MNKRLKTEASRNVDVSEFRSGESAVEETKHDVTDGNNVVENSAAEETIAAETKLKHVPMDVVIGGGMIHHLALFKLVRMITLNDAGGKKFYIHTDT
ncbi:hypothetical protein MKW98_029253 [Papaver atlanticum]|uniref:Uncharacterized protein n=1 Tax=Papaver atlanticum TaxID=357466 RepID=A0AAD4SP94_9MAGN|nr:hypothetical protein MKW98_029253 [Papaver atlanticum]